MTGILLISAKQKCFKQYFLPSSSVKLAESHCSDNDNDTDEDAKGTQSIGWMSVCIFCVEQFNQKNAFSLRRDRYRFHYRCSVTRPLDLKDNFPGFFFFPFSISCLLSFTLHSKEWRLLSQDVNYQSYSILTVGPSHQIAAIANIHGNVKVIALGKIPFFNLARFLYRHWTLLVIDQPSHLVYLNICIK